MYRHTYVRMTYDTRVPQRRAKHTYIISHDTPSPWVYYDRTHGHKGEGVPYHHTYARRNVQNYGTLLQKHLAVCVNNLGFS